MRDPLPDNQADLIAMLTHIRMTRMVLTVLTGVILCLNAAGARGPGLKFDRYTVQDGLSQSTIQSILQDSEGFLWFATLDGLNRFDGTTFVVYRHDPRKPLTTLPDNEVRSLYEDRGGGVWVSTAGGGLSRFDRTTGTFASFRSDPGNLNSLSGGEVTCMFEDSRGSFWVGTEMGLNRFNSATGEFTRFRYVNGDGGGDNVINDIYEDSRGAVWFGTNAGLKKYDIAKGTFQSYDAEATAGYRIGKKKITSLREDERGRMWVGTTNGLYLIDEQAGLTTHYQAKDNGPGSVSGERITFLREDRAGRFWVGTNDGLDLYDRRLGGFRHYKNTLDGKKKSSRNFFGSFLDDGYGLVWLVTSDGTLYSLDPGSGTFSAYRHDPGDPSSIAFNKIHCFYEDRSGSLWFGSIGGGLSKLSRKKVKFGQLEFKDRGSAQKMDFSVTSIVEDGSGDIWIGTADYGLAKFSSPSGKVRWFKHDPAVAGSLSDDHITTLTADDDGFLWVGTRTGDLDRIRTNGNHFVHYRDRPTTFSSNDARTTINTSYKDSEGNIWIGTNRGAHRFSPSTGRLRTYDLGRALGEAGQEASITAFSQDYSGIMWIGTSTGHLIRLDTDTELGDGYIIKPDAAIRKLNAITAICADRPDRIWIGTSANGLFTFHPGSNTFGDIENREMLAGNRINSLLPDGNGNLWMSTNVGLTLLSPETGQIRNYNFTDGLQSNEFNRGACVRLGTGELLFGGISGVNRFHPDSVRDNPYVPELALTSFRKFDREEPVSRTSDGLMSVELEYSENFFTFGFAAMDFTAPERNQYAYYMEGFDHGWIYSGTRNIASYTNLDPGIYRFHFKGSNNDGVWNETGSSVRISILPPFWKAGWFQFMVTGLFVLVVYGAYRYQTRSIQIQKKTLAKEVNERTKELWDRTRELRAARDQLELRVHDRTIELQNANEILRSEIVDRIEAQEQLQRLKEFHENIVQTMAEGMVVVDMEGVVTYVNPAAAALLGYERDVLEGKHWSILVPSNARDLVREADERRKSGLADHYELQMLRKDGTRVDVFVGGSPLHIDGVLSGTIAVFTDITGLKIAESRIKEQAALIDKARDAIIVTDVGGLVTYWNRSAETVYGWPGADATGKNIHELLHVKSDHSSSDAARIILEKGEWSGELHQTARNGKSVIMRSRWTLLHGADGFPKSIMMINTDITEKVKLEKQFLRAQRMESLGTLASGIAHDLNNVLSPIIMALQVLRNKRNDEHEKTLLTTMELSAKRGADIVKQVLMFARGAEGKHDELQVKHLIREMESIVRETFPKSIVCHTDVPKDLWTIMGDPTQMHQVLLNLCVNARDAMPDGGRLDIKAENIMLENFELQLHPEKRSGAYIVIGVSDSGHGMSQDTMMKIFEPFFTTKGVGKGTGLGLSTVNGIIKGHGGFINVYSEPGEGSTFRVYLPAVPQTDPKTKPDECASLPGGRGEVILLVDDEPAIRQIAKGTLETYGYRVLTASDGEEAEKVYRENIQDVVLVITDMMMPVRDGRETIRVLKSINPGVKIVVTSGLVGNEQTDDGWGKQTQAFLAKPFTAEKLLKTLQDVLHAQRN